MNISQIKFSAAVTISGRTETFFTRDTQGLRGTQVEVDGQFLKFTPMRMPPTLVPLVKVDYIILSEEKTTGETLKTESSSVNVGKKNKQNS